MNIIGFCARILTRIKSNDKVLDTVGGLAYT